MHAFTTHRGYAAPLDRANVDTDQIIPKQFLKSIRRTGFGENLFDAWRFRDEGVMGKTPNERELNPDFVLNDARYQGASVLLARDNFGCGSSREHAVWALQEYGFRAVIAPSFADIFFSNSFKNGLLLIVLEEEKVLKLLEMAEPGGLVLDIDLNAESVVLPNGESWTFHVDPKRKHALMAGLDDIGLTLAHSDAITTFEQRHRQQQPWIFDS